MEVKKELLYDGMYYDVTKWIQRHPGGRIIEMFTSSGEDSTHAVQQLHQRSTKKVMNILKSLPRRPATEEELDIDSEKTQRNKALTKDFLELYQQLQDEGLFKPDYFHVFLRLFEIFAIYSLGAYFYHLSPENGTVRFFGVCLSALALGRSGWIGHESGHNSLTGIPKVDRFIEICVYGVLSGLSGSYWVYQHSRHHAMPQHIKHDIDLRTLPLVAFNHRVVKTPQEGKGFFLQNQKWLFLTVDTFLVGLFWKFFLHPRYCLRKKKYFDLFCMAMHFVFTFKIVQISLPAYLVGIFFTSLYLLGNFTLSHTHLPVTDEPTHWVEYSLCHTANVRSSWWVDFWMGNLNYQIEHHLFPTMPQFKNKLCRDRVKALAKKHNLPYMLLSYSEAAAKTFQNLGTVSKELALM